MDIYISLEKNQDNIAILKGSGQFEYKVMGNNILVAVKNRRGDQYLLPTVFIQQIKKVSGKNIFISAYESGGKKEADKKFGDATIVCGSSGKKLKPFITIYEPQPCGLHGAFVVPNSINTISIDKMLNRISLKNHTIKIASNYSYVWIVSKEWFGGKYDYLSPQFDRFKKAYLALLAKTKCPQCRCLHFAENTTLKKV